MRFVLYYESVRQYLDNRNSHGTYNSNNIHKHPKNLSGSDLEDMEDEDD